VKELLTSVGREIRTLCSVGGGPNPPSLLMPATPAAEALLVTPSTPSEPALVPVFTPAMAPLGAPVVPTIANPAELEAVRVTVEMFPAPKLPEASRLTMAFATLALVGGAFQASFKVPLPVTGEAVTVKSVVGALRPTLVTVPAPGIWTT
jgi:hypothetical protein